MLLRLKLPALLCFCTWLADPWRVRPLLQCPVVGESSTFSLSSPGENRAAGQPPLAVNCRMDSPNSHTSYSPENCLAYFILTVNCQNVYEDLITQKILHSATKFLLLQRKNSIRKQTNKKNNPREVAGGSRLERSKGQQGRQGLLPPIIPDAFSRGQRLATCPHCCPPTQYMHTLAMQKILKFVISKKSRAFFFLNCSACPKGTQIFTEKMTCHKGHIAESLL